MVESGLSQHMLASYYGTDGHAAKSIAGVHEALAAGDRPAAQWQLRRLVSSARQAAALRLAKRARKAQQSLSDPDTNPDTTVAALRDALMRSSRVFDTRVSPKAVGATA